MHAEKRGYILALLLLFSFTLILDSIDITGMQTMKSSASPIQRTEPIMLNGWPQTVDGAATSSIVITDIENDGIKELVVVNSEAFSSSNPAKIYAFKPYGSQKQGSPIDLPHPNAKGTKIAVGDINADNKLEIAGWAIGSLFVMDMKGNMLPGWPTTLISAASDFEAPTFADINGDGEDDLIVATGHHTVSAGVYVFDKNGNLLPGWPAYFPQNTESSAGVAVADIDKDGKKEIVAVAGYKSNPAAYTIDNLEVYAFNHDGTLIPGWPRILNYGFSPPEVSAPVIGNFDNDQEMEVVYNSVNGNLYVFNHDGTDVPNWPVNRGGNYFFSANPAIGDIDGDGKEEIITTGYSSSAGSLLYIFKRDSLVVPGWPQVISGYARGSPTIGDIDGDIKMEVLIATEAFAQSRVHAWNHDGTVVTGFPLKGSPQLTSFHSASPVLGDLNNDGKIDIAIGGDEPEVLVWTMPYGTYNPSLIEWEDARKDARRTGDYRS